jgi:hypothetical protein
MLCLSLALVALFVLYFFIPHGGAFRPVFGLSMLYIVILPIVAMVFSIKSLRQIAHTNDRGRVLSYIALGITTLYFMVALAIPLVLVGLYLIYSFVI